MTALSTILSGIGTLGGLLSGGAAPVTLGGTVLDGVEVPSVLSIGGRQVMAVHKLPGGAQIVQAMGDDPSDLVLRGVFLGSSGSVRAQSLESLRMVGRPVTLAAAGRRWSVVVGEFSYDFAQQGFTIPYNLVLKVLPQAITAATAGDTSNALSNLLGSDVASAVTSVANTGAQLAADAQGVIGLAQTTLARVAPVASLLGLGVPLAHAGDLLTSAQTITATGVDLAQAPAIAATLVGGLQGAASSLSGVVGTSGTALGQIGAAAPAGSLLPADPGQVVAATGHALAQAGGVQALFSVNRAILNTTAAANGTG